MKYYRIISRTGFEDLKVDKWDDNGLLTKERYKRLRNLDWELLLKADIKELPVNLTKIINHLGLALIKYSDIPKDCFKNELEKLGFLAENIETNKFGIFYNDKQPIEVIRFTIAHEIGHFYLKHKGLDNKLIEKEANMFSARLLMPVGILNACKVSSPEEIAKLCRTSLQASSFRFSRLKELHQRSKFYTSPLERQLLENFRIFIALYISKNKL